MDLNHFTRSDSREPGTWKPTKEGGAIIVCPVCRQILCLGPGITAHTITDGKVNPSVACNRPGCTYREFITLDAG
jgi:hypothetical protein